MIGLLDRRGYIDMLLVSALLDVRPGQKQAIEDFARLLQPAPRATAPIPVDASELRRGNPFAPFARFEGRKAELAQVRGWLGDGQSTLLIGGRRAGKTALIRQLQDGELGRKLILLDAAAWPLDAEERLLAALGQRLGAHGSSRDDIARALEAQAPLALVIDEADRLIGHAWSGSFLAWLRALDEPSGLGRGISLLLVGGPAFASYRNPDDRGSPAL